MLSMTWEQRLEFTHPYIAPPELVDAENRKVPMSTAAANSGGVSLLQRLARVASLYIFIASKLQVRSANVATWLHRHLTPRCIRWISQGLWIEVHTILSPLKEGPRVGILGGKELCLKLVGRRDGRRKQGRILTVSLMEERTGKSIGSELRSSHCVRQQLRPEHHART